MTTIAWGDNRTGRDVRSHGRARRPNGTATMSPAAVRSIVSVLMLAAVVPLVRAEADVPRSPQVLLQAAKAASGGKAWDRITTQHSVTALTAGGVAGKVERWSELATGRSYLRYAIGDVQGVQGFDGRVAWVQDATGQVHVENAPAARELAVNIAYRDKLAMWYPQRAKAAIEYKERVEADGARFDIVGVTPEGGRPFEFWINADTMLIERLVEREAEGRTRTEIYMDFRDIDGVKIPFRVRASRGDPRYDDLVVVDSIEFNASLAAVDFAVPATKPQPKTAPSAK
jgi:hypothetical protein